MTDGDDHLTRFVVVWATRLIELGKIDSNFLNAADRDRATRFRFEEDRSRFVLGRRLLAKCLTEHLSFLSGVIDLELSSNGRPIFPDAPEIQFSISHTGDLVAVALSNRALVGVDLEVIRDGLRFADLGERIFSPAEFKIFCDLPAANQPQAFFQAWTGKEACLKATGQGIATGMAEVSVPLQPQGFPQPIINHHDDERPQPWRIQALPLPASYAGNVVWNDPGLEIDFRFIDASELAS